MTPLIGNCLNRRNLLQGLGALTSAAAVGIPTFGSAQEVNGPLSAWFGSWGPQAGAGLKWSHGLNLCLTGTGAEIGRVMSQGAQCAADLVRASGGPDIQLKLNDHQGGLVAPSVSGVRRLISQEHIQSLGMSYGPASEALFPIVAADEITAFWSGGAGPSGLNKKNVWITMALFALDPTTGGVAYLAKRFPDAKRLALVGQQENGVGAIKEIAPKVWPQVSGGGTALDAEWVNIGTTDFSSLIARIKGAKADAIFTTIYGNDQGYFLRQMREAGIHIPIMSIDLDTPTVPDIAGDAIADNCFLAVDGYLPENENPYNKLYVETYKKKFGALPDYFSANFFEQVNILAALICRAVKAGKKPQEPGVLSEVLAQDPSFPSVYGGSAAKPGIMTFDVKTHAVTKPIGVFEIGLKGVLKKVGTIVNNSTEIFPA